MSEITVECANKAQIRLRVTAEFSIPEWEMILRMTDGTSTLRYYSPLNELVRAIRQGITEVERREVVKYERSSSESTTSDLTI